MNNFKTYKWIESAFILAGFFLLLVMEEKNFWIGLGLGLLAQGTIMIVLDIFAEKRAGDYISWIRCL